MHIQNTCLVCSALDVNKLHNIVAGNMFAYKTYVNKRQRNTAEDNLHSNNVFFSFPFIS